MRELFGILLPILPLHIAAVTWTVIVILLADHEGYVWVRGKEETLDPERLKHYHRIILTGLIFLIVTGAILFWPLRDYLFTAPVFYIKMAFVFALIINSFAIDRFLHVATKRSFKSLTKKERLPLFASGAVSAVSWVGAIVAAFNLGL